MAYYGHMYENDTLLLCNFGMSFKRHLVDAETIRCKDESVLHCREQGVEIFIRLDKITELVTFQCPISVRYTAPLSKKLRFINWILRRFDLVKIFLPKADLFLVEYQFYTGGQFSERFLLQSFYRMLETVKKIALAMERRDILPLKHETAPFGPRLNKTKRPPLEFDSRDNLSLWEDAESDSYSAPNSYKTNPIVANEAYEELFTTDFPLHSPAD